MKDGMKIVVLGLSITSSWGNGHATTYRGLLGALTRMGDRVTFLERDVPWYGGANRDMPRPEITRTELYESVEDLRWRFSGEVREADVVIVGSYVPDGIAVCRWVLQEAKGLRAFYDIDTPVTLAALDRGDCGYLEADLIPQFDLYLSFSGGRALEILEGKHGSPCARPLYCSVDPTLYYPRSLGPQYELGYMGTYSPDRQPTLDRLLVEPARRWPAGRFAVAGPQYPAGLKWPDNVNRIEHIAPANHCAFYNMQRFTLNVTRADMIRLGHSPSVRLFEAAACGVPIISDRWDGLTELFRSGEEILIAETPEQVLDFLRKLPEVTRMGMGAQGRERVLAEHTATHRATQLRACLAAMLAGSVPQMERMAR